MKVGISQLAVDGAENLKILCSNLQGWFEKRHAGAIVTRFTEPLTFKSQVQAGWLHPAETNKDSSENKSQRDHVDPTFSYLIETDQMLLFDFRKQPVQ